MVLHGSRNKHSITVMVTEGRLKTKSEDDIQLEFERLNVCS